MLNLLIFNLLLALLVPIGPRPDRSPLVGYLSQYGRRPSEATIQYRQDMGQLPADLTSFAGFIAVSDCRRIGQQAYLAIESAPYQLVAVFDCSGSRTTTEWMERNQIIAEVSYDLAVRHGFVGEGGVIGRILWLSPPY